MSDGRNSTTNRRSPMKRQQTAQKDESKLENKDLIHGITEKEVEIEHLKTVIVALDEKVQVITSVREDLTITKDHLKVSEQARVDLQN